MSNLPNSFKTYLKLNGFSDVSVRNYLSDLNHFLAWFELTLRSRNLPLFSDQFQLMKLYFKEEFVLGYKSFLLANHLPLSTINRRLSTLRTFGKFCLSQRWISENPAKKISNIATEQQGNKESEEKILDEFRRHLESEKTSSNTIKNYLSDIREFFTWAKVLGS